MPVSRGVPKPVAHAAGQHWILVGMHSTGAQNASIWTAGGATKLDLGSAPNGGQEFGYQSPFGTVRKLRLLSAADSD
jgi:hypothetical protein